MTCQHPECDQPRARFHLFYIHQWGNPRLYREGSSKVRLESTSPKQHDLSHESCISNLLCQTVGQHVRGLEPSKPQLEESGLKQQAPPRRSEHDDTNQLCHSSAGRGSYRALASVTKIANSYASQVPARSSVRKINCIFRVPGFRFVGAKRWAGNPRLPVTCCTGY